MVKPLNEAELQGLPLRALVAFAARCARRVQPLFVLPKDCSDRDRLHRALDQAIAIAEKYAADRGEISAASAYSAATALDSARVSHTNTNSARIAASSAAGATYLALTGYSTEAAILETVHSAINSATVSSIAGAAFDAAQLDLQCLARLRLGRFPDPGKPLDPSVNGPLGELWPRRVPYWYLSGMAHPAITHPAAAFSSPRIARSS